MVIKNTKGQGDDSDCEKTCDKTRKLDLETVVDEPLRAFARNTHTAVYVPWEKSGYTRIYSRDRRLSIFHGFLQSCCRDAVGRASPPPGCVVVGASVHRSRGSSTGTLFSSDALADQFSNKYAGRRNLARTSSGGSTGTLFSSDALADQFSNKYIGRRNLAKTSSGGPDLRADLRGLRADLRADLRPITRPDLHRSGYCEAADENEHEQRGRSRKHG